MELVGVVSLTNTNAEFRAAGNPFDLASAKREAAQSDAGISWSVENPDSSHMWNTEYFQRLNAYKDSSHDPLTFKRVIFHHCMHGGKRDKRTCITYGGKVDLASLGVFCDKAHTHLPWGLTKVAGTNFATSEERNYPDLLCRRIAARVAESCGIQVGKTVVGEVDRMHMVFSLVEECVKL